MLNIRRTILAAAFGGLLLAAPAHAQQAPDDSVIGAPELRNFELPGTRTTPPTNEVQPVEREPAPTVQQPPVSVEPPAPASRRPAQPSNLPASPPAERTQQVETPADTALSDSAQEPAAQFEFPDPVAADPVSAPVADEPLLAPQDEGQGNAIWIALWLGLLGLMAFVAYRRSRKPALAASAPVREDRPAPPAPAPRAKAPAPAPVAALKAQVAGRPRKPESEGRALLELEFAPDRMVATEAEAIVHFQLAVRNTGKAHAKNIRMAARMINASAQQDQEIDAFFANPVEAGWEAGAAIAPTGTEARFRASVAMPRAKAREYNIGGKPLFVPVVAVTIFYEWDEFGVRHEGQTSRCYLVGVEPKTPSDKMGAFRLDLGPRIYRSVGQRQSELAKVV